LKRLIWLFVAIPAAVLLIVFSVANRTPVTLSLDPFATDTPALAFTLPFFVFLFLAFLCGLVFGGVATWLGQGRYRRSARFEKADANRWRDEADAQRKRAEGLAAAIHGGAPAVTDRNRAA